MIDHITIRVSDIEKSTRFYTAALAPLGYARLEGDFDGAVAFKTSGEGRTLSSVWLAPLDHGETPSNVHIAFSAPSEKVVREFYDAAIAAGGRDNGVPGKCPEYGDDYYAGFVFDPDGNNVEAVVRGK